MSVYGQMRKSDPSKLQQEIKPVEAPAPNQKKDGKKYGKKSRAMKGKK